MSTTIAFINQKGGTGKTTSTINIGAGLGMLGKRTLLIDLDPQANLTYSLGLKAHEISLTMAEILEGVTNSRDAIIERNGIDVLPANLRLAQTEANIFNAEGREHILKKALVSVKRLYDFILIDCPPSLGVLTLNALVSTRAAYIPVEVEFLALQGLNALRGTIELVRKRLNNNLQITGIIATKFDGRKNLNKEVLATIREHFGKTVFKTPIRDNIALAEAPGYGQTIFEYRLKSYGAEDYLNISKEVLKRSKR